MWYTKGQLLDGWYVKTGMKFRNCCLHHNEFFSSVYFRIFMWWRFLFTHVTYCFFFQWNSPMSSTTSNGVINVKPNWECCFFMFFICFLVRKINTWTVGIAPEYTFPVWKCIIRMRICAHCRICHIRFFGINITPIWNHCIFVCFIYVMWFLTRPSALRILAFILDFFKFLSHQDSNDECILLAKIQHSQPHMNL